MFAGERGQTQGFPQQKTGKAAYATRSGRGAGGPLVSPLNVSQDVAIEDLAHQAPDNKTTWGAEGQSL